MSVILAQESRVVRKYLRAGLGATRYAAAPVLEIESGSALLQSLKEGVETDTLILLDWNLPGLDVPILLDYLSRKGILDRVAILLCVNSAQAPAARETLRRGARGYLTRPFSDQELAAKIAEIRPPSGSGVLRDIVTTLQAKDELPSLLSLPPALQARLFEHGTRAHHEEGAILVSPGELVDSLSFVTRGEAEVLPFEGSGDGIVRGAGECFAERAFICGEPANLWVRALTAVDVVSVTKESVVELARGHAALQDFLTVLLTRRAGRAADEGGAELAGTTASLPFSDLLQYLHSTRKTGVLLLRGELTSGRISVERGEVCDARAADGSGETAFHLLAGMEEARFEFKPGGPPAERTIFQSTMKLLMSSFLRPQEEPAGSVRRSEAG